MSDSDFHVFQGRADALEAWLLVGSTGRIGRMLRHGWEHSPPSMRRMIYQCRGRMPPNDRVKHLQWLPLEGATALREWVDENGPINVMVMMAGVTPAYGSDFNTNVALAEACMEAAEATGISRVLVASSSAVYGSCGSRPCRESDVPMPVSEYGQAKLAMEQACAERRASGLDICCLRIGNVAGADALLVNSARASEASPLKVDRFPDGGGPIRSYIGPRTLGCVIESVGSHPGRLPQVLNVAAPTPVSMQALADAASLPWEYVDAPATAKQRITLDCSVLESIHTFGPEKHNARTMVEEWRSVRDSA